MKTLSMPIHVLITPGGTEVGAEIWRSLRYCKEVRLHSASSESDLNANVMYARHRSIPDVKNEGFLESLNSIVDEWGIACIYPAHDYVLDFLSANRERISAGLILPSKESVQSCRSKKATYNKLKQLIPCPKVYEQEDNIGFPLFAKPDSAYGGAGTTIIKNGEELRKCRNDEMIITEYLPGREYTVDCFSSLKYEVLFCGVRQRERIRMGTSLYAEQCKGEVEENCQNHAVKISKALGMQGAWYFQVKEDDGGCLKLLEVSPRIAGSMGFYRACGVNFPLLSILQQQGVDVKLTPYRIGARMFRSLGSMYDPDVEFERVYVDLDDTIVVHGKINTQIVQFLYQCVNKGKKIILLSKNSDNDKGAYLAQFRLQNLFDEIIWLHEHDDKSNYINPAGSIFIDDSFSQRMRVGDRLGIPTFDPSMIEILLDHHA